MGKQNKKPELTIDQKVDKVWYSRWIAIREDEYQTVLIALEELAKTSAGQFYIDGRNKIAKDAKKALATFKRGQKEHYAFKEEHKKMMKNKENKNEK